MTLNIVDTTGIEPEETLENQQPDVPKDIYLEFPNESAKTQNVKDNFDFLKLAQLLTKVKGDINVLHESLKKKSNVYIFGAGGTTSWFLPKLLKIYNDAFNKVPALRYNLNIVLLDADIV